MTDSERIKELKKQIRQLKKSGTGGGGFRVFIRLHVLIAYYQKQPIERIAKCYDISTKTINRWILRYESGESATMQDKERQGRPTLLNAGQQAELKKNIQENNQRVWVARHLVVLVHRLFAVAISVKYLPQLLQKLGLSFHKAVKNLVKKDSEKRRLWIQETLPKIYQKKIEQGWRIFYQDEVGFQTEGTLAYSWGERGQAIEIANYGRHGRMNMMGAFELGTGLFYGVQTSFKVNAQRFRRFICHLKREMCTDKILLICDNASFHKAKWLTAWVESNKDWLKLEFLPPYSPDFNPIERLWRWMKTEYTHNHCWSSLAHLKKHLQDALRKMPECAESLKTVMRKENERYHEICAFYQVESRVIFQA
jgi:transposase